MNRSADPSHQWVYYLTAGLLYGSASLRSLLIYRDSPLLGRVSGLLLVWLFLFISETAISRKWSWYFQLYLGLQTILVCALMYLPETQEDFFAVLFGILSMQAMQRLSPRAGAAWSGLFTLLMALLFQISYGTTGVAFTILYTAVNILLASYALAARRARAANDQNQALVQELQETNRLLQSHSAQRELLAVARERNRLARELHDSVTQTIFSMNLTTQSAALLFDRDPARVGDQLERVGQLARNALSEIQLLISELSPAKVVGGGLVAALRQHLTGRTVPEDLSVSLEVEGDGSLRPVEEQGLFRIVQEALNNVEKHACTSQASLRLHLVEPYWIEVADQGLGFDVNEALTRSGVGLSSMCERASEIGWDLQVITAPGAGTRIRVEKLPLAARHSKSIENMDHEEHEVHKASLT
jgi:signal transduction histidine kinase